MHGFAEKEVERECGDVMFFSILFKSDPPGIGETSAACDWPVIWWNDAVRIQIGS